MDKNELIRELNRCTQIQDYLMKISNILGDNIKKVDKIHDSLEQNCTIMNKYPSFKQEIVYNGELVNNLLKKVNDKIKRLNMLISRSM